MTRLLQKGYGRLQILDTTAIPQYDSGAQQKHKGGKAWQLQ
jgi:hypothetical protein